jgi:hypothetical protein
MTRRSVLTTPARLARVGCLNDCPLTIPLDPAEESIEMISIYKEDRARHQTKAAKATQRQLEIAKRVCMSSNRENSPFKNSPFKNPAERTPSEHHRRNSPIL